MASSVGVSLYKSFSKPKRQEYKLMQKGKASRLTEARLQMLNSVGFVWEAKRGAPRQVITKNDSKPEATTTTSSPDETPRQAAGRRSSQQESTGASTSGEYIHAATLPPSQLQNREAFHPPNTGAHQSVAWSQHGVPYSVGRGTGHRLNTAGQGLHHSGQARYPMGGADPAFQSMFAPSASPNRQDPFVSSSLYPMPFQQYSYPQHSSQFQHTAHEYFPPTEGNLPAWPPRTGRVLTPLFHLDPAMNSNLAFAPTTAASSYPPEQLRGYDPAPMIRGEVLNGRSSPESKRQRRDEDRHESGTADQGSFFRDYRGEARGS
jgi:hypothetical protein